MDEYCFVSIKCFRNIVLSLPSFCNTLLVAVEPTILKPLQASLFNSSSWKQETKHIQKDKEVVYERNVTVRLSSKWLEGNIRVVANDWGFYIANATSTQSARIRRYIPGEKAIGAIWIKRSNGTGWNEVVHFYNGAEISIGYITRRGREVLYKEDIHQESFKEIKFN